ncbi:MAG: peroxiredoxin [candidate division Zixibacteria bacterium]|nr:peroxiredoxin [candidate division Zixibacteria bacterium]
MYPKIALILIVAFSLLVGCSQKVEYTAQEEPENDGVFIHITKGPSDPHEVLMALQMAVIMAEDKDVLVYFDIDGVRNVLSDSKDIAFEHFPSSHTQLTELIKMEVPVMACPGCLKAAGESAEDLMDGVMVADKERFFNFTNGRILTLDY